MRLTIEQRQATSGVWRSVARALVVALFAAGLVGVAASPSQAAGCYDYGCDGRNPDAMGCYPAGSEWRYPFSGGSYYIEVEIRYATSCNAVWGRIYKSDCLAIQGARQWYVSLEVLIPTPYGWVVHREGTATSGQATCSGGREWSFMRGFRPDERHRVCYEARPWGSSPPARNAALSICPTDFMDL